MKAPSNNMTDEKPSLLLTKGQDFKITPLNGSYELIAAITYRSPRGTGEASALVVTTSTMHPLDLNKLRVEEIDGQHFVVNDPSKDNREAIRLCVESDRIGQGIIAQLIASYTDHAKSNAKNAHSLDASSDLWRWNSLAEQLAPLVISACAVLLSASGSIWLLFR